MFARVAGACDSVGPCVARVKLLRTPADVDLDRVHGHL